MEFKTGDIILNKWASADNPIRYSMVFKKVGKYTYCWYIETKNRIGQCRYYTDHLKRNEDGMFSVVGHCDFFVEIRNCLEKAKEENHINHMIFGDDYHTHSTK